MMGEFNAKDANFLSCGKQRMKKCLNTLRPGGQKYFIVRFVPCVDSMARKMYVNTKSYDIKNNNQRILFH